MLFVFFDCSIRWQQIHAQRLLLNLVNHLLTLPYGFAQSLSKSESSSSRKRRKRSNSSNKSSSSKKRSRYKTKLYQQWFEAVEILDRTKVFVRGNFDKKFTKGKTNAKILSKRDVENHRNQVLRLVKMTNDKSKHRTISQKMG